MYSWRENILNFAGELDVRQQRRAELRNRRQYRRNIRASLKPLVDLPETEVFKTFRFGKATIQSLVEELSPLLPQTRRNDALTPEIKVLITLAFYASGSYQTLVGQSHFHHVSQTSVSRAVRQVTDALNSPRIFHKYVKWPCQREERTRIITKFHQRFGIPGVLGCIDGTHVAIVRPHENEERFFNRKGYHSLNVMIITDSDLNILWIDASNPGSANDSGIWNGHPLRQQLTDLWDSGDRLFLLGDSGYPLRKTLMTPILNTTVGTPEHHYYNKHVKARNTVERCIGVLKARFRCLLSARSLHYHPGMAGKIVNACAILHNIANGLGVPVTPLTADEVQAEALRLSQDQDLPSVSGSRRANPELIEGRAVQQALVEKLWRERGHH